MLLDIVILPPRTLRQRIGKAVLRATRAVPCKYIVDNKKLIPHVSLFHLRSVRSRLPELSQAVKELLCQHEPFQMKSRGVRVGNVLYFWLSKPAAFMDLHREVVQRCHEFRTGEMPWTSKKPPTKLEVYFRKRYGIQHVLRLKDPHFTLLRLKDKNDAAMVADRLKYIKFKFMTNEVAICEVNRNFQVTQILKRFRV